MPARLATRRSACARTASWAVAGLMALASVLGLLVDPLYRDNLLVSASWRGTDLVTLVVAVPLLALVAPRAGRQDARADLVWLGLLDYALYNYLFYLFGAAFNGAFLVYVAIVVAATVGLVFGLASLDVPAIGRQFDARTPVGGVAVFLGLLALGLGGFHVALAVSFFASGAPPALLQAIGHPTSVISALDLWLVVTPSGLAAVWLWRREPWGVVLAAILTVKGAVYMAALSAATLNAARVGALDDLSQLALWPAIGVGSLVAALAMLAHTPRGGARPHATVASGGRLAS